MMWKWEINKGNFEHDYAMTGFAVSVSPAVWDHFKRDGTRNGKVHDALERVVRKIHKSPSPNAKTL
jgi:hypothetical protein